jgi:hypothetical protein
MSKTRTPSRRLTFADAVEIWFRIWSGEFLNRIAADYDVNPGRIAEIKKEYKFVGSKDVASARLH